MNESAHSGESRRARAGTEASARSTRSVRGFLDAARNPIEYAARGVNTAARTRLAAGKLAAEARRLAGRSSNSALADLLANAARELDAYERAAPGERVAIAARCSVALEQVEALLAEPPSYRSSMGDVRTANEALAKPVRYLKGVGPQLSRLLGKAGFASVEDLVYHLPFRYEDRRRLDKIATVRIGEEACLLGEIVQLQERTVGRNRRRILEAVLRDETGLLGLTWYNMIEYFRRRHRTGQRCAVFGRVEASAGGGKRIVHPEVEEATEDCVGAIVPVYERPGGISVAAMRKIVHQAVREVLPLVPSVLPASAVRENRVTDLAAALAAVHFPERDADLAEINARTSLAHRSIVFDELFYLQLGMLLRRRSVAREPGLAMPRLGHLTERLAALLPFALTGAQRRVLEETYRDMAAPRPMHRLVQGDVGSGKTIVALFAALVAVENGLQAAFMAPTELLAEQHFRTIERFASALGVRAVLLTGKLTRGERSRLHAAIAAGAFDLVVGTHAIIQQNVRMPRLGLGVIDEQHRFGVLQRAALRALRGGERSRAPDILLMSATPIPRTLAMTLYGDLDVSALDELPPGRKPVQTMIFGEADRRRVYDLVKRELDRGRQAYVVYPLVEPSDKEAMRDATTMAEELGRAVFAGYRVGLVHGRMKAGEKEAVMERFRSGDVQVLVSTTVVEVGVDVPNATVMVVEHAERFGLSQLHQLRGRVGRGADRSTCMLIAPHGRESTAWQRLDALRRTNDGFEIAEKDLELRGPGDFLGTRQSGLPDFRVASLLSDVRLLGAARSAAELCLERAFDLETPDSAALRAVLLHRWAGRLGLAEIG